MNMQQYNIHAAKTHLSALVEKAATGSSFIIAKAGKPMVKVIPFSPQKSVKKRIGFLKGQISIPADFNQMGQNEIIGTFEAT
jgi:prevent-host-death family protein